MFHWDIDCADNVRTALCVSGMLGTNLNKASGRVARIKASLQEEGRKDSRANRRVVVARRVQSTGTNE